MATQPTQRGMIEQLLVKVIEISESQATQSAEIKSINKTIHNGMSHRIDETHRTVMLVKDESYGDPDEFGGESNEFDEELLKAYRKLKNDSN